MYLSKRKQGNYTYLHLFKSERVGKKVYRRFVKSFGRLDQINESELDKIYAQYSKDKVDSAAEQSENLRNLRENAAIAETGALNVIPSLHYGHLILKPLWDQTLGLRAKFDYEQAKTKIKCRISEVAFYLSALKILRPGSYLNAYESQTAFLGSPIEGVGLRQIYRVLDFLYDNKDALLSTAVRNSSTKESKDAPRMVFYDCTNCYFETPYDDRQQLIHQFRQAEINRLNDAGLAPNEIDNYLDSDKYTNELNDFLNANADGIYRLKGASKEHRYDLPIVSIALVIDRDGIPLDFQVYPGNKNEKSTMQKSILELKKKYSVQQSYVVADAGLNSTVNLDMLQKENLGFVVSQSVLTLSEDDRKVMLAPEGWQTSDSVAAPDLHDSMEVVQYKVCDYRRSAYVLDENGKHKKTTIDCKIMYTYSEKRRQRDEQLLDDQITKAKLAVQNGFLMGNSASSGWRSFVQTAKEKAEEKSDKEQYRAVGIKEDLIKKRRTCAGYAAIVYASPKDLPKEATVPEQDILGTYSHLVRIEECFRIMKTNFSIRPMNVRIIEHITAHCLICVLALIMLRKLEIELRKRNANLSVYSISDALWGACVMPMYTLGKTGEVLFSNTATVTDVYSINDHSRDQVDDKENDNDNDKEKDDWVGKAADNWISTVCEKKDPLSRIMLAMGLQPLAAYNTLESLNKSLKLRMNKETCLGKLGMKVEQKLQEAKNQTENKSRTTTK